MRVLRPFAPLLRTLLCCWTPVPTIMPPKKQISTEQLAVISTLVNMGKNNKEIAQTTGIPLRTVQRWTQRARDDAHARIVRKPRPGKKRKLNNRTLALIRRQVEAKPSLTARQIKKLNSKLLDGVAIRTLQDYLHKVLNFRRCRAVRKPWITKAGRGKRLLFARLHRRWDFNQWKKVLWSDEATFTVTDCTPNYVYRKRGSNPLEPRYTKQTVKHPDSVMVCGCFSFYGVGKLVFLPKNVKMNRYNYLELLCDHLPDSMDMCKAEVFQQDGAPCHTAKYVVEWLQDCCIPFFKPWPGNSPDLNPIENLWALIKTQLQDRDTSSLPKLQLAIQDIWDNFNPRFLQNLALSLPRRLQMVRKSRGYPIKY